MKTDPVPIPPPPPPPAPKPSKPESETQPEPEYDFEILAAQVTSQSPAKWREAFTTLHALRDQFPGILNQGKLEGLPHLCAKSIEDAIKTVDPITSRAERLNDVAAFLGEEPSRVILREQVLLLKKLLDQERNNCVLRFINQSGYELHIQVDGVDKPFKVPLDKTKRFVMSVGPQDRDLQLEFTRLRRRGAYNLKVRLERGSGREFTVTPDLFKKSTAPKATPST